MAIPRSDLRFMLLYFGAAEPTTGRIEVGENTPNVKGCLHSPRSKGRRARHQRALLISPRSLFATT